MTKVKETRELHIGEYNCIMEIFRYSPVEYCSICNKKRWSSYCKCGMIPLKIGCESIVRKFKVRKKKNGSREEPKRGEGKS